MRRPGLLWAARALVLLIGGLLVLPPMPAEGAAKRSSSRRTAKVSATKAKRTTVKTTRSRSLSRVSSTKRRSVRSAKSRRARYSARRARARRAALARARAAAALRAAMTPQFRTDANGDRIPDVRAAAAIVHNPATGQVLYEENSNDQRSIASITKVMTALIVLENEADYERTVTMASSDTRSASHTYLRAGERLTVNDLLHLLLIGSDNAAARALARESVFGYAGFIDAMNAKAANLGLTSTQFADPSGLDADNVSSAYDIARLIVFTSGNPRIASIMQSPDHHLTTSRRAFTLRNTNRLVGTDIDVRGGKTGFIRSAGYCLATLLRTPQGDPVAVVVLGARSNTGRFWETRHLLNWLSTKTGAVLTANTGQQQ
jgi:serine-type D-Ala-D-Ala endopeptidase (penicillin-binding protein 7)